MRLWEITHSGGIWNWAKIWAPPLPTIPRPQNWAMTWANQRLLLAVKKKRDKQSQLQRHIYLPFKQIEKPKQDHTRAPYIHTTMNNIPPKKKTTDFVQNVARGGGNLDTDIYIYIYIADYTYQDWNPSPHFAPPGSRFSSLRTLTPSRHILVGSYDALG